MDIEEIDIGRDEASVCFDAATAGDGGKGWNSPVRN
jgi:hypothetical protein